jgi:hypothetical protein
VGAEREVLEGQILLFQTNDERVDDSAPPETLEGMLYLERLTPLAPLTTRSPS